MPISNSNALAGGSTTHSGALIGVDRQRDGERDRPDGYGDLQGILPSNRHERNRLRLVALMTVLDVSGADIARAARVSTALVSKVLSGRTGINPDTVYSRLEAALTNLVAMRNGPVFEHAGTNVDAVLEAAQAVKRISPSGRGRIRPSLAA